MKVQRVSLSGEKEAITFEGSKCGKWLVKNFSEDDIYCSFDEDATESESIKIASECGQIIVDNEFVGGLLDIFRHDTLYISGTGEVEVQQLCWNN